MKKPFVIFSKRLERGTILWLCICVFTIFLPRILMFYTKPNLSYTWHYQMEYKAQEAFHSELKHHTTNRSYTQLWKRCHPSSLSLNDWQKLGLSPKQAISLLKYRDKYGLNTLDQMKRIRVLPTELLNLISDSLFFEAAELHATPSLPESRPNLNAKTQINEKPPRKLDLNSATEVMMVSIPGLGKYTAGKIITFRNRFGGFLSISQLHEIPGLSPEVIGKIEPYLELTTGIQQIDLNQISYEKLKQHPYLTWNQANSIIKMRNQKGLFRAIQELKESVLIDDETYKKLLPYLSL